jgi:hypothetical protein
MEYWNDGLRGEKNNRSIPFDFYPQYSIFPPFHVDGRHFSTRLRSWTMVFFSTKAENFRFQNPPSNLGIKTEISRLWSIPDHQQGIRCKAARSDD